MSSKNNIKVENEEILNKSQAGLLEKIEAFRLKIKSLSERELAKATKQSRSSGLIPTHAHTPGMSTGGGVEDVSASRVKELAASETGKNEVSMKSEKCTKCGDMHMPMAKCGSVVAEKSELIDAKGDKSSNSVVTEFNDKPKEFKNKGSGGKITLPGSKLQKKVAKALTAGMNSGAPSMAVNQLGKAGPGVPAAKPPSGINMATHTPSSKPGAKATGPAAPAPATSMPKPPGVFGKIGGKMLKKQ